MASFIKRKLWTLTATVAITAGLGACTTNPVTGKSQLSLVSPAQEISMGEKQYLPSQQSQGGKYELDQALTAYVNRVGQKLAKLSDRPELPYEFVVLNNDVPNAWALPGGKIAFNRGLLVELKDESQLAAVLGHEIVHAAASHSAQQMSQQQLLGIGSQLAGVAVQNSKYSRYGGLINQGIGAGGAAFSARYGREQELEADAYGMEYMVNAGYDPMGAVELQQTFVRLSEGRQTDWLQGLFASHPPSQQRVDTNRARAAQMPKGTRNKAEFERAMGKLRKDQPAYDLHKQAMEAAGKKDLAKALSLTQRAIKAQPNEALFWDTKGKLLMQGDDKQAAYQAFTQSIELNPNYYSSYLGRGVAAKELGKTERANIDFETSVSLLPTPMAVYQLGEYQFAKGDYKKAYNYYRAVAGSGGQIGKAAQARMHQINPPAAQPSQQRR